MKQFVLLAGFVFCSTYSFSQKIKDILSPDKAIRLALNIGDSVSYQVFYKDAEIVSPSYIEMVLGDGRKVSAGKGYRKAVIRSNNSVIVSPVPEKRVNIPDIYTELKIDLRSPFSL